jgi:ADP-ribose pyrophosphatase YjhB (NUDIX family)
MSHKPEQFKEDGLDHVTGERFFRPLGGAVEFGEAAVDALRREIREELDDEIEHPVLLGVLENLFQFDGTPCHEIVFVFEARLVNTSVYAQPSVPFAESGTGWDETRNGSILRHRYVDRCIRAA